MLHQSIVRFIAQHHLLTLCTCDGFVPYCANCFYAFDQERAIFIVATDSQTRHGREALANEHVAGTIALETKIVGKIQGVQFTGIFKEALEEERRMYFQRFPYALAMLPEVWSIRIDTLKFTDNTLGFGKKLEFRRVEL